MRKQIQTLLFLSLFCIPIGYAAISDDSKNPRELNVFIFDNKPLQHTDSIGRYQGFFVDILQYIAEEENWNINYINKEFNLAYEELNEGKIDLFSCIVYSDHALEKYNYNKENVYANWAIVCAANDIKIDNILDINGKKLVAVTGDYHYQVLKDILNKFDVKYEVEFVNNYTQVYQKLDSAMADVGIVGRANAQFHSKYYNVKQTNIIYNPVNLHFLSSKNSNTEIIDAIDKHLKILKQDPNSIYYQSLNTWFSEKKPEQKLPKWIIVIIGLVIFISLLLSGFILLLRYKIKVKTQDLREELNNRKKAEKKAEESDRLKSAFLANMSHEIRTPLNAILGYTKLMFNKSSEKEKFENYIQVINASGKQLLNVIHDIIEISKIQSGQLDVIKEETHPKKIIQQIRKLYKTIIKDSHLDFIFEYDETEDIVIYSDTKRIIQVFSNLIDNAIKYTNEGKITIGYNRKNNAIRFFVRDTGIGIPEKHQKMIFDRFVQTDEQHLTRKYGGTGLGLSISKELVHLMQGKIWVESEEKVGSVFSFTIPINY